MSFEKRKQDTVEKREIIGFDVTEDQDRQAESYSEKTGCGYMTACQILGFKPVFKNSQEKTTVSDSGKRDEEKSARMIYYAIRAIGQSNQKEGLIKISENGNRPHDVSKKTVEEAPDKAREKRERATETLRRFIGSPALQVVFGDRIVFDDNSILDVVQDELFGQKNASHRQKIYRRLEKIGHIDKKSTKSRR